MSDLLVNNISITQSMGTWVTKQSAIFPLLFYDPNLPLSPPVPADSNTTKKKAVFRFSFCPSAQFYCWGEREGVGRGCGGVSCLQLPLPSWCPVQYSGAGSTTVTTLAHGCEETTCYLLFADRPTKSNRICRPIFTGDLSSGSFLLHYKKCTIHCTI